MMECIRKADNTELNGRKIRLTEVGNIFTFRFSNFFYQFEINVSKVEYSIFNRIEIIALLHPGAVTAGNPGRGPGQGPVLVPAPVHAQDLAPQKGDQGKQTL